MDDAVESITSALASRGLAKIDRPWQLSSPEDGNWYFGSLQTARGAVSIYLFVADLSFVRPPDVWLAERPSWLQGWRPHLVPHPTPLSEWLCYSDHEKYQLLANAPDRAILRVIEDTKLTIDRIADPISVVQDSKREMARLWPNSIEQMWIDIPPSVSDKMCGVFCLGTGAGETLLVTDDPKRLAKKLGMAGEYRRLQNAMIFADSATPLYLTAAGPPKNLLEVRTWLQEVSPATYNSWHSMLQSKAHFEKPIRWHLFRASGQVIGFFLDRNIKLQEIKGARAVKTFMAKHVYQKPARVHRIRVERIDDEYLIRRNLAAGVSDLRGLRILLVGCGAIGGYLAQGLVQLGAGLGTSPTSGRLSLCDRDFLSQENVGRHSLGLNYISKSKASAVKAELNLKWPGAEVEAIESELSAVENRFEEFDLIVNASGYHSVGRYLSKWVRGKGWLKKNHALLHVWIEGRGGVTRALLEDDLKEACFDCMWHYSVNQEPRQRDVPYSENEWYAQGDDGYATMTPFAVSAPLAATALAIESLLAWRSLKPSPRFRSRNVDAAGVKLQESRDLKRGKGCPGCST